MEDSIYGEGATSFQGAECNKTNEKNDVARNGEPHTPYFDMVDEEKLGPNPECEGDGYVCAIGSYEMVNHPAHYNNYSIEVIDMMEAIWGPEKTALWCEMTAFKYRMRLGTKPENPIEQDLEKENWYLNKAKEIKNSPAWEHR